MEKTIFKNIKRENYLIGATYSLTNAFDLFNDGVLLLKYRRLPRAYTLFQLSMEEAGKVMLLLEGFIYIRIYDNNPDIRDDKEMQQLYDRIEKVFSSHHEKMKYIMTYELRTWKRFYQAMGNNIKEGTSFQEIELEKDLKIVKELNDLKNFSLYTSTSADKFIHPIDGFDFKKVDTIRHKAFSKIMLTKGECIRFLKQGGVSAEIDLDKLDKLKLYSEHS